MATGNAINANTSGLVRYNGSGTFDAVTTTNHNLLVGAASNGITNVPMTNGQVPIGSTGADPVAALPTSTGGTFLSGAGSLAYIPANYMPGVSNLGIAYSAGTFTVQSANGTALSATNPAYVTLQSLVNPGNLVTISVTANQTFTDAAGSNQISGNNFGVTSNIAWNTDMPFFLYAVMNSAENTIAFMITRVPARTLSPAAGNIGQSGSALATTQGSMFSLLAITAANYANASLLIIGSFRMRKTTTANDWTVQALSLNNAGDGIGFFQDQITFSMPVSQNGAGTGKYITENGGTAPVFTTQTLNYKLNRSGLVIVSYDFSGDGGTDGSGNVTTQLVVPHQIASLTGTSITSGSVFSVSSAVVPFSIFFINLITGQSYVQINSTANTLYVNGNFSNGARTIQGQVYYLLSNN